MTRAAWTNLWQNHKVHGSLSNQYFKNDHACIDVCMPLTVTQHPQQCPALTAVGGAYTCVYMVQSQPGKPLDTSREWRSCLQLCLSIGEEMFDVLTGSNNCGQFHVACSTACRRHTCKHMCSQCTLSGAKPCVAGFQPEATRTSCPVRILVITSC